MKVFVIDNQSLLTNEIFYAIRALLGFNLTYLNWEVDGRSNFNYR